MPRVAEQRGMTRESLHTRCWLSASGVERYVWIDDLSDGGARVLTAMPPEAGDEVELRFRRLGRDVETRATVVWSNSGFRGRGGVAGLVFERATNSDSY